VAFMLVANPFILHELSIPHDCPHQENEILRKQNLLELLQPSNS